jgi:rhodanese-related sulfurtransferase
MFGLQLTTLAITMNYFEEITVQQAAELIGADNQLWILDTRDANSYQEQHIDGAMQAHAGLIEHLIKKQDYDRPIIVYCYHGKSSKDVASILGRAGYKNVYSLQGGYVGWKKRDKQSSATAYSSIMSTWLAQAGFEAQALNASIANQTTPLMLAAREGRTALVQELIAAGADLESVNTDGNTALWAACYAENLDIIELLLAAGANINHQNGDGVSALIYTASAGKTDVVALLLAHGAHTHLATVDGFTALDLAANRAVIKLLMPA